MEDKKFTWILEIQKAIKEIGFLYCLNSRDLITFLTATWCRQMVLCNYSEEFVKKTLDHMLEIYLEIKKKKEKE